jgi:hypothetical protein
MIDYSPAGKWALHVRAHAMIESQEDPNAIGDDGQARGLLQLHPANFQIWYGRALAFPSNTTDTWIEADLKTCASFYDVHNRMPGVSIPMIVQAWRLGISAVMAGMRDAKYLALWQTAYDSIGGT